MIDDGRTNQAADFLRREASHCAVALPVALKAV
jgi:hypothetical protein